MIGKNDSHHTKCHCGVEKSTAYSIEYPGSDGEGKAETETDEKQPIDCGRSIRIDGI